MIRIIRVNSELYISLGYPNIRIIRALRSLELVAIIIMGKKLKIIIIIR